MDTLLVTGSRQHVFFCTICMFHVGTCATKFLGDQQLETSANIDIIPTSTSDVEQLSHFAQPLTGPVASATWPWIEAPDVVRKANAPNGHTRENLEDKSSRDHVYLWILSDGHVGSTALSGLIATSPMISTLCDAHVWQCEGEKILRGLGRHHHSATHNESVRQKNNATGSENHTSFLTKTQRGQLMDGGNVTVDWNWALREYRKYWNSSKKVLLDKSPAFLRRGTEIAMTLRRAGLRSAFVAMTHSCCTMSTRERGLKMDRGLSHPLWPNANLYNWNWTNAALLHTISQLKATGENVLHVRYEDMIRDPQRLSEQIVTFLPQLGKLNPSDNGLRDAWWPRKPEGTQSRQESLVEYITKHPFANTCSQFPADWGSLMRRLGYY
eukprot:m.39423 g.39423  ORF g.39423 m.39423 type:complete len:383 (+) comp14716_c0_seq2:200-1348(+)